jgi:hypothetical protein
VILEIALGIYAIVSIFIIINLTRKVERLEEWGELLATRVTWIQDKFKEIDSKGIFESDDEVGTIFSALKDVSQVLTEVLEEDQNG